VSSSSSSSSSSLSSSSESSSSSSESCPPRTELWQKLRNQGDIVDIYVTWRDCTLEVETFETSGSSNRDVFFKFNNTDTSEIISFSLSDNDFYDMEIDDNLFMAISGGNPVPDNFFYRVEYKD
jgi:hypothetical protein